MLSGAPCGNILAVLGGGDRGTRGWATLVADAWAA